MQCPNCSTEIEGGNFCTNCGSPLPTSSKVEPIKDAVLEPDSVEMPQESETSTQPEDSYTPPTYDHAPGQAGGAYVPPVGNNANPSAAKSYGTSSQGILNQAWDDLIHDPSLVKKAALMGLIECVPVLNFVNIGYGLRWGRRAAFRTGDKLPQKIFGDRAFEMGFYAFVVILVWALAMGVISIVPLIGTIVVLGAAPFLMLAAVYVAMVEEIGAGFRLGNLWEKGKRSYGGILAATYVPGLVVGLVVSIIMTFFMMMLGLSAVGVYGISGIINNAALVGIGAAALVALFVLIYLCAVLSVLARLITYRALGYWIGRMAPEWIQESIAQGTDPR